MIAFSFAAPWPQLGRGGCPAGSRVSSYNGHLRGCHGPRRTGLCGTHVDLGQARETARRLTFWSHDHEKVASLMVTVPNAVPRIVRFPWGSLMRRTMIGLATSWVLCPALGLAADLSVTRVTVVDCQGVTITAFEDASSNHRTSNRPKPRATQAEGCKKLRESFRKLIELSQEIREHK